MDNPGQEKFHTSTEPLSVLVISASLRRNSYNTTLSAVTSNVLRRQGVTVVPSDMNEFDCVSYNYDLEHESKIPAGAELLRQKISASDALVIASPEYNGSMPGHLKNVIDWVSRFRPQPINEKHILLLSASPSMAGGNRGLWSLRMPLEHLGARVFPDMFSLAVAHQAFSADDTLKDTQLMQRLETTIAKFLDLAEAAKKYPCAKRAWTEFLGEKLDAATARTE